MKKTSLWMKGTFAVPYDISPTALERIRVRHINKFLDVLASSGYELLFPPLCREGAGLPWEEDTFKRRFFVHAYVAKIPTLITTEVEDNVADRLRGRFLVRA